MIRSIFKMIFGLFLAVLSISIGTALTTLFDTAQDNGLALAIPLISLSLTICGAVLCIVGLFQFVIRAFRAATRLGSYSDI